MKKRLIFFVLVLIFVFALSACGTKEPASSQSDLPLPVEDADEADSTNDDASDVGGASANISDIATDWKFSSEYMALVETTQTMQDNTNAELNISIIGSTILHINSDGTYTIGTDFDGSSRDTDSGTYTFEYDESEKVNILVLNSAIMGSGESFAYENGALYVIDADFPQWVKAN